MPLISVSPVRLEALLLTGERIVRYRLHFVRISLSVLIL